ncbi:MAG: VOC family protein [Candidatus Bathyarchaeia archaeon]
MIFKFDKVSQVAIVVRNLEEAMKRYWEDMGIGPWKVWYFNPSNTRDMTFRGKPSQHAFRIAEAMVGDVSIELIEPLEGETTYKEFLDKKGEGLHHIKYTTDNPEEILEKFRKLGIEVIQSGRVGQGSYHYLDTESRFGFILELATGQPDRPPDEIYPKATKTKTTSKRKV